MTGEWPKTVCRRLAFFAVAALVCAAAALAYSGPAVVTHPTGNHVSCQDFGYTSHGVLAPQGGNGQYSQDYQGNETGVTVTISNYQESTGQDPATFDWSATGPIAAVFVKAGSSSDPHNLYTYDPPLTADVGVESPKPAVSHALFCLAPPTAVHVRSFTAKRAPNGVVLRWRTGSAVAALGFNVYRQEGVRRVRLNAGVIPAAAPEGINQRYRWVHRTACVAKRYWLQAVAANGTRSWVASAKAL